MSYDPREATVVNPSANAKTPKPTVTIYDVSTMNAVARVIVLANRRSISTVALHHLMFAVNAYARRWSGEHLFSPTDAFVDRQGVKPRHLRTLNLAPYTVSVEALPAGRQLTNNEWQTIEAIVQPFRGMQSESIWRTIREHLALELIDVSNEPPSVNHPDPNVDDLDVEQLTRDVASRVLARQNITVEPSEDPVETFAWQLGESPEWPYAGSIAALVHEAILADRRRRS